MERLRVGIAGLGIGAAVHLPVFASMPGVRVEGVASSRPEKAAAAADKYGVPHSFGDVSGLLELELDAIVLALPPKINGLAAGSAVKRGIAVLAEKPLAGDADSARILADLARGHTAMVNFQFAELRTFAELGRQLEAGAIAARTSTDRFGRFQLSNLPEGRYYLIAVGDAFGHYLVWQREVSLSSSRQFRLYLNRNNVSLLSL